MVVADSNPVRVWQGLLCQEAASKKLLWSPGRGAERPCALSPALKKMSWHLEIAERVGYIVSALGKILGNLPGGMGARRLVCLCWLPHRLWDDRGNGRWSRYRKVLAEVKTFYEQQIRFLCQFLCLSVCHWETKGGKRKRRGPREKYQNIWPGGRVKEEVIELFFCVWK